MNTPRFLVDTNTLITPYLNYYPFDFAPGFGNSLKHILQAVKLQYWI